MITIMKKDYILSEEELLIQKEMDDYLMTNSHTLWKWQEKELIYYTRLAQDQVELSRKTKQITLRISEADLVAIRAKAIKYGIPYQTLMWAHLHQLAIS